MELFSAFATPMGTSTITTPHGTVSTDHSTITVIEATEGSTRSTNKKKESMMKNQAGTCIICAFFFVIFKFNYFISCT